MKTASITGITLLLIVLGLSGSTGADELNVPSQYATIQAAIDAAVNSDEVIVADDTYTGVGNKNIDFNGKAIIVRSEKGPQFTTIDCEDDGSAFTFHMEEAQNSVVVGFTITRGSSYNGGAISCDNSSPTIKDCIFFDNLAEHWGGAVYVMLGSPVIENCEFNKNRANEYAGAAFFGDSAAVVSGCIFVENSSGHAGAIFNEGLPSVTIVSCLFVGNTTPLAGGAIENNFSDPRIINCTFNGNSTLYGGAIYNGDAMPIITNCIFWGNDASTGDEIDNNGAMCRPTISFCDIEGGWDGPEVTNRNGSDVINGGGNIAADPLFIDAAGGDLRLSSDSPCIDTGYNNVPNLPATDMDGHPRILDGDCNDTEVVDMGAYEFNYAYMGDFDYDCSVDFVDFSIFGLAWITKPGDAQWNRFCDISKPSDNYIDWLDVAILCDNWLAGTEPEL